jgi:DNA polymerase-1
MAKAKKINEAQSMMFDESVDLTGSRTVLTRPAKPLRLLGSYRLVTTLGDLDEVEDIVDQANAAGAMVSFDTEFSGAGADVNVHRPELKLVGLSLAVQGLAWYIPVAHKYWDDVPQLPLGTVRRSLNDRLRAAKLATHNGKVDTVTLVRSGFDRMSIFFDTMTAAHTLQWKIQGAQAQRWAERTGKNPDDFFFLKGLKPLAENELGILDTIDYEEVIARSGQQKNKAHDFALVGPEDARAYVGQDADLTIRLAERWLPMIEGTFMEPIYRRITMPLLTVLAKMEQRGIYIDINHYRDLVARYETEIAAIDAQLREALGRNTKWKTDSDLRYLFHKRWRLPVRSRTRTGEPAVGKNEIAEHVTYVKEEWKPFKGAGVDTVDEMLRIIKLIQTRAKTAKLLTTYDLRQHAVAFVSIGGMQLGEVHTEYGESATATNRLASRNPNSQNMPAKGEGGKDIRNGIIAPKSNGHTWHMIVADLSQIEPRCTAYFLSLLNDHSFLNSYKDGRDIYKTIASAALSVLYEEIVDKQRGGGKVFVLAATYGSSAAGLASNTLIEALGLDLNGTKQAIESLFAQIPGLRRYHWNAVAWGLLRGYTESLWGFARPAGDLRSSRMDIRAATVRALMNHVIQSFASQVLNASLVWIDAILVKYSLEEVIQLILQIHDEIDSRVRDDYMLVAEAVMQRCMRHVTDLGAPMKIDVEVGAVDEQGSRWGNLIPFSKVELCVQHEDTQRLIAAIEQEPSPFADMPLAQMATPFDLTVVPDDDLPIYLWHAANIKVVLDDQRLPVCTNERPRGYITGVKSYEKIDKKGVAKTTYRATMVGRGGNVPMVSFTVELSESYAQVNGKWQPEYQSFLVDQVLPIDPALDLRDALRTGTPTTVRGHKVDCRGLRRAIDATIRR